MRIRNIIMAGALIFSMVFSNVAISYGYEGGESEKVIYCEDRASYVRELSELLSEYRVSSDETSQEEYQARRIIVFSDRLRTSYGAVKVLHYGNKYILQYDTVENTSRAYEKLREDSTLKGVYLDSVITAAPPVETDFHIAEQTETVNAEEEHHSWGISYMGLDRMQTNLENAGYGLDTVVVAVLDTGVNYRNPYLDGRLLTGHNFLNPSGDVMDTHSHGTHVTGIICDGTTDNVKILPVKVFDGSGAGTVLHMQYGILYAIEQGASVINLSLTTKDTTGTFAVLDEDLQDAINNRCIPVCAAGNGSTDVVDYYPSRSPYAICVSSLNSAGEMAGNSNFGMGVDFIAPGVSIISTMEDGLGVKSGTSMAAPHVSACVALLKTWNPNLSFDEVYEILKENSMDLGMPGKDVIYGNGCPNLAEFDVSRSTVEYKKGDLNGDGTVNLLDLRLLLRYICGKNDLSAETLKAADVAGDDGVANLLDLREILRYICGKSDRL